MYFSTESLINPMYSSALFAHEVPSSSTINMVKIFPRNFHRDFDLCSLSASHMIESGVPISFSNYFTACSTSELYFIGTTYTNYLSVTKSGNRCDLGTILYISLWQRNY